MCAMISVYGELKNFVVELDNVRKAVDRESLMQALEAGGAMIQESVQRQVQSKAKSHPRGQLSDAISMHRVKGADAVSVGWEDTPMRDKPRKRSYGPTRMGTVLEAAPLTRRRGRRRKMVRYYGGFTDVNGRFHNVTTVADYARILEYSESRKLRHMKPGTDEVRDQVEKKVADIIDRKIAKALK